MNISNLLASQYVTIHFFVFLFRICYTHFQCNNVILVLNSEPSTNPKPNDFSSVPFCSVWYNVGRVYALLCFGMVHSKQIHHVCFNDEYNHQFPCNVYAYAIASNVVIFMDFRATFVISSILGDRTHMKCHFGCSFLRAHRNLM